MDSKVIRRKTISEVERMGYPINSNLPLIDHIAWERDTDSVLDRMLVLNVTLAVAYGYDRAEAAAWLRSEGLIGAMTEGERAFVMQGTGDEDRFKQGVEALWALAYITGKTISLDHTEYCSDDLVRLFPDLRVRDSHGVELFRRSVVRRSREEVHSSLDLVYCIHWAVRNAQVSGKRIPGRLMAYAIEQRCRAIEWCCATVGWDDVELDT